MSICCRPGHTSNRRGVVSGFASCGGRAGRLGAGDGPASPATGSSTSIVTRCRPGGTPLAAAVWWSTWRPWAPLRATEPRPPASGQNTTTTSGSGAPAGSRDEPDTGSPGRAAAGRLDHGIRPFSAPAMVERSSYTAVSIRSLRNTTAASARQKFAPPEGRLLIAFHRAHHERGGRPVGDLSQRDAAVGIEDPGQRLAVGQGTGCPPVSREVVVARDADGVGLAPAQVVRLPTVVVGPPQGFRRPISPTAPIHLAKG